MVDAFTLSLNYKSYGKRIGMPCGYGFYNDVVMRPDDTA